VRQLIFGMNVQSNGGPGIHADQADLRVLPPDQPGIRGAAPVRFVGNGIDQRRPLNLIHVDDDTGGKGGRRALIGKRGVRTGRILSGEREMIEPNR
jgi:hypothetical protein